MNNSEYIYIKNRETGRFLFPGLSDKEEVTLS